MSPTLRGSFPRPETQRKYEATPFDQVINIMHMHTQNKTTTNSSVNHTNKAMAKNDIIIIPKLSNDMQYSAPQLSPITETQA